MSFSPEDDLQDVVGPDREVGGSRLAGTGGGAGVAAMCWPVVASAARRIRPTGRSRPTVESATARSSPQ
jgi:hypothetical protein